MAILRFILAGKDQLELYCPGFGKNTKHTIIMPHIHPRKGRVYILYCVDHFPVMAKFKPGYKFPTEKPKPKQTR